MSNRTSGELTGLRVLVTHPSAQLYGSDRVVLESVIGLADGGAEVVVTVPGPGPLIGALHRAGARVIMTPTFVLRRGMLRPRAWAPSIASLITALRAARAELTVTAPDVVYVNTVTQPVWPLMARLTGRKVLVHVHEAEAHLSIPYRIALAVPARLAGRVVFNSETSRSVTSHHARSAARRSVVVYNGVRGHEQFTPPRDRLDGAIHLLYVGRISPRKGPDVAVEAVGILRAAGIDTRLDLLGDVFTGYEWFAEELKRTVADRGLLADVRLRGFSDDIWPALAECDIVLVPSRLTESFGNTAVEAVLAGRPVVVTDAGGLTEAVAGVASSLTVPAGDATELAYAVQQIIDGWPRFRAEAIEAAGVAATRFSPARYRQEIVRIVAGLAGHP